MGEHQPDLVAISRVMLLMSVIIVIGSGVREVVNLLRNLIP